MSDAGAKTREVASGVVEVCLPLPMKPTIVNVWLVRGGSTWTLIDTGMHLDDSMRALTHALDTIGLPAAAITRIVCTHHHIDHYGSSEPLRVLTGAAVHLHPLELERVHALASPFGEGSDFLHRNGVPDVPPERQLPPPSIAIGTLYCPAAPAHLLADEEEIPLGAGRILRVIWTPGHTPGHCCFLLEPDGILFAGDHLLPKITPHVGLFPGSGENPLGDFLASHQKLLRIDTQLVCPAHGGVYEGHRRRALQLIDFHRVRKLDMLEICRRRPHTAYEIALQAFAITPDNRFQVLAATAETLAHLELLRRQGRVLREDRDGLDVYRAR